MKTIVIGAGAAGLLAALFAARNGADVTVIEKNEKAGKKIYITGKGRCNLTNACDDETFFNSVKRNPKFLYSSYSGLTAFDVIELFESLGLKTKTERGNRVFPESEKASDVTRTLTNELERLKVKLVYNTTVKEIVCEKTEDGISVFKGVKTDRGNFFGDALVIATGGLSYASTGSTGDGYEFAKSLGHSIKPCTPSLVSFELYEDVSALEGLSLKNVTLTVYGSGIPGKAKHKQLYKDFGEMLFTRKGISGPLVLSASSELTRNPEGAECTVDLKPTLDIEKLDRRILKDFEAEMNKEFKNSLFGLMPQRMAEYIVDLAGIDPQKKVNLITAAERRSLAELLKKVPFRIKALGGFNEAVITCGGVNVKEVDPKTMESKLAKNVYFAGEVLDLDALTGGFNLQIAWCTGAAAGKNAAEKDTNTSTTLSTRKGKDMNSEVTAIAIDGPAGAGKSTIAKKVAKDLGYIYVDTGAMYRAMAIHFIRNGVEPGDTAKTEEFTDSASVTIKYINGEQRVFLNDEDVTAILRTPEVSNMASVSSTVPKVRLKLVALQRELASRNNVVMDGRDIGSYVLPNAKFKVYMTASIEERARRRYEEMLAKGEECDLKTIEKEIAERDYRDSHRDFAPLVQAPDAILIDTSDMTIEEVTEAVKALVSK